MLLVSEPEAAAIYTARVLREENGVDFFRVRDYDSELNRSDAKIRCRKASASCSVMLVEEQSYVYLPQKRALPNILRTWFHIR
jgi:hypothetical protein